VDFEEDTENKKTVAGGAGKGKTVEAVKKKLGNASEVGSNIGKGDIAGMKKTTGNIPAT